MVCEVEPRALYPNVKCGFLAMRWPLELHENIIPIFMQTKKPDSR